MNCGDSSALSVTFQLFGFCGITKEQRPPYWTD